MELEQIAAFLVEGMQEEIAEQGHYGSGALSNSITVVPKIEGGIQVLEGQIVFYGRFVDTGRKAGVTRVPVQALKEWVEMKNMATGEEATRIAFAIREKIFQEGIPTRGSRSIATRRTGFIGAALEKMNPDLVEMIKQYDKNMKIIQINNIVRNANTNLR